MKTIAILMYHSLDASNSVVSIAPQAFSNQMACVVDAGFRGISLREAVAHRDAKGSWPEKSVVLTFDDGFANFYESAWPVLAGHGFTATVFVVSDYMGGRNDWAAPPSGLGTREILSWRQASELSANKIEIGSHTRTHPNLRRCSVEEVEQEMSASRAEIEDHLGLPVSSFAYPYGEVSPISQQIAARLFRAACTTVLKHANGDSLHSLPRIDAHYVRSPHNFQRLLRDQLNGYLAIRRLGRIVRRALMPILDIKPQSHRDTELSK